MRSTVKVFLFGLLACGLVYAPRVSAQGESPTQQPDQNDKKAAKQAAKQRSKRDKDLFNELDSQYKKWLNEDVVYIISPEERSAFLHLQTNEEREQFIEQFWQRRNPDPVAALLTPTSTIPPASPAGKRIAAGSTSCGALLMKSSRIHQAGVTTVRRTR